MSYTLKNPQVEVPSGFCHCGCGMRTERATKTSTTRKVRKGDYSRFLPGHSSRNASPRYIVNSATGCWIWQRKTNKRWGYGYATISGRTVLAHRAVYEEAKGPIGEGLELDHLCGNPSCVNPDHLEQTTAAQNIRRSKRCKLTMAIADEIRSEYATQGTPQYALAKRHGVSQSIICRIIRREAWA